MAKKEENLRYASMTAAAEDCREGQMLRPRGLVLTLLGAESTGKTTIAYTLERVLRAQGVRCVVVAEYLREFCETHHRTPTREEQHTIAEIQAERIETAMETFELVIADTSPLMTAVYSELVFGDRSLYADALDWQGRMTVTAHASQGLFRGQADLQKAAPTILLMGLDLPWVADGIQRDGPQFRPMVDRLIRNHLEAACLPYAVIEGSGTQRIYATLQRLQDITPGLVSLISAAWSSVCAPSKP